jgi:hypothetical protein
MIVVTVDSVEPLVARVSTSITAADKDRLMLKVSKARTTQAAYLRSLILTDLRT